METLARVTTLLVGHQGSDNELYKMSTQMGNMNSAIEIRIIGFDYCLLAVTVHPSELAQ